MAHTLPPLPYAYDALEPYLDEATLRLHHAKHYEAHVRQWQKMLDRSADLGKQSLERLLAAPDAVPEKLREAVRCQGGGVFNHAFFWGGMGPACGGAPTGELAKAIAQSFGGFDAFKDKFSRAATEQFGCGWTWLAWEREQRLVIVRTEQEDCPLARGGQPLLGLDVWEHAYYLKYQNRRAEYIRNWWNVVDWKSVAQRYKRCRE